MAFISFKNIKLFKSPAFSHKKDQEPSQPSKEEKTGFWLGLVRNPVLYLFFFALVLAFFISYLPSKSLPLLSEGEIAAFDIMAPADLTVEDTETTANRKKEAEDAVLPVYSLDPNVFLNTEEKVRQFFSFGRDWLKTTGAKRDYAQLQKDVLDKLGVEVTPNELLTLDKAGFGADLEEILVNLLEKYAAQGIIVAKNLFVRNEPERGFSLLRGKEGEKVIKLQDILELKEVKEKFVAEINKLELPARKKGLLISLSFNFISPNVTFNKIETETRQEKARQRIETVYYRIKRGKVIVRKGDEVTADTLKMVRIVNQNLRTQKAWLSNFLGTFLLFGLLLMTLWYYLKSLHPQKTAFKYYLMIGITLIISLFLYKLSSFLAGTSSQSTRFFLFADAQSYQSAFPYEFGVILFAFLTTIPIALIYNILNSLLVGYLFNANFYLMIFSFIGGLAAIYGIKYFQKVKRTSALRAGIFLVSPVNVFVIITFYLIQERWTQLHLLTPEIFMGIMGGILCAALAFVFLPVYETVFSFLTQSKLLELTNSESPIFRQMALEAPGSYHHSLIVASLAEKAAEAIKLDPLFVKAGALYHDIGKIKMPEYFIENKVKKKDIHKDLTPSMSTLVIVNHVKEGVEIAKKEKLPAQIKEIIEQHHGNSLVRFFYQKAKEKYDPEMHRIGEESYRYPGPPPQSKEAALVMLSDSVEAASRSLKNHREENHKRVIKDIFDNYLQDGQLDDCNFSLKELRVIASSFLETLNMIYQPRVDYPGFDFEMKKKNKAEPDQDKDNGRGNQPPEDVQN